MIIQYLDKSQNHLEVGKTLTELTSGNISVEEAVQILTNLSKQEEQ